MQLAKVTTEPVLTTSRETTQFENADLSRISGQGAPAAVTVEETPAAAAVGGRAQAGEVFRLGAPAGGAVASNQDVRADERARTTARTELPQTASNVPNLMLVGALALAIGLGLSSAVAFARKWTQAWVSTRGAAVDAAPLWLCV